MLEAPNSNGHGHGAEFFASGAQAGVHDQLDGRLHPQQLLLRAAEQREESRGQDERRRHQLQQPQPEQLQQQHQQQ